MIKKSVSPWGFVLPGLMFAGIGLGLIFGNAEAGLIIGLAAGFLTAGWLSMRNRNDQDSGK